MRMYKKYDREELSRVVAICDSFTDVCRTFGKSPVGGNTIHVRQLCQKWNIDYSHMTGSAHKKGKPSRNKRNPIDRLFLGSPSDCRTKGSLLKAGLIALGIKEECVYCGCGTVWNGKPITLEINHKDGQYWNNVPENLEMACPNCHSQY